MKKVSSKKYEIRILGGRKGNYERNAVVKNQGTKQRVQRNSWRLLAMENQRAVYRKETIAVSATI